MTDKYAVKTIFPTIQGEGCYSGTPAIFVRFAGCNLACPWCDTDFQNGISMRHSEIVHTVVQLSCKSACPITHVVLTGGEPAAQVRRELVADLQSRGFFVQMETNGTYAVGALALNWITCSPKIAEGGVLAIEYCHELKVVLGHGETPPDIALSYQHRFLSPKTNPTKQGIMAFDPKAVDWVLRYAVQYGWRVSMQMHKLWGID